MLLSADTMMIFSLTRNTFCGTRYLSHCHARLAAAFPLAVMQNFATFEWLLWQQRSLEVKFK